MTPVSYNNIGPLVFSHVCNGKFAVFWVPCCGITCKWALFPNRCIFDIGLHKSLENIIDPLVRAKSRLQSKINVYEFQQAKSSLLLGFFVSHRLFYVSVRRDKSGSLAFRMTIIEDTHLPLAVIPFKVETSNSLIFSPL